MDSTHVKCTDSQCPLDCMRSLKPLSVPAQNRIAEINKGNNLEICHVNTQENPADMPSSGVTSKEFKDSTVLWNEPQWLQASFTEWPT